MKINKSSRLLGGKACSIKQNREETRTKVAVASAIDCDRDLIRYCRTGTYARSQIDEILAFLLRTTLHQEKAVSNSTVAYENHRSDKDDGTNRTWASFKEETCQVQRHKHRVVVQQKQVRRAWNEKKRQKPL